MKVRMFFLVLFILLFILPGMLSAEENAKIDTDWTKQIDAPYTKKGADRCLKCHDAEIGNEEGDYPILPFFKSKHGKMDDERSPMAGLQCEACHGPGGNHRKKAKRDGIKAPILNFGEKSHAPVSVQNKMCLQCHTTHARIGWEGSVHEIGGLACANCHQIHVEK